MLSLPKSLAEAPKTPSNGLRVLVMKNLNLELPAVLPDSSPKATRAPPLNGPPQWDQKF
jgi:hypothetical protein